MVFLVVFLAACASDSSPSTTTIGSSARVSVSGDTSTSEQVTTTTRADLELGDPKLISGHWLVSYEGVDQYPEHLFFTWEPGDRWGLWEWRLAPTCPEMGCTVALTTTNLLYGPGEKSFEIGEFVYADERWIYEGIQDFEGACLPSDAPDWANDDFWHFDAFTGSEIELTVVPSDPEFVDGEWTSSSLEVIRVETGIYTSEAAEVCDLPTFSRSVATAVPSSGDPISELPEPSEPQRGGIVAVSHKTDSVGYGISLFDMFSDVEYDGVEERDLGLIIEDGTYPEWSPDGTLIAFTRTPRDGPPEVWVAASDGSDPRFLAVGYEPVWSPDGSKIAVRRDEDREDWTDVYLVLLPGGQVEQGTFRGWAGDVFWLGSEVLAVHDAAQSAYWKLTFEPGAYGLQDISNLPLLTDAVGEAHVRPTGEVIVYAAADGSDRARLTTANQIGTEIGREGVFWKLAPNTEWDVDSDVLAVIATAQGLDWVSVNGGNLILTVPNSLYQEPHSVAWTPRS